MSSLQQSAAFFVLICAILIATFAAYTYQYRSKLGVRGLLLCLVGMSGWSAQIAVMTWPTHILPVHLSTLVRYLFQFLVIFGWPLLVWEYSNRTSISLRRSHIAALLVIPLVTIALTLTNPWHHLVLAAETPTNPVGISALEFGPWYLIYMGFAITLVLLPVGRLLSDFHSAHDTHRKQILLLLAGWFLGFPGALFSLLFRDIEAIPQYLDPTPLTFILAAGLWGTALFRYNLFSMLPVSRRTAIETMPDPVVSVDSNGTVVDANPAAQQLFRASEVAGMKFTEFCAAYPTILSLYEFGEKQTAEVSLDTDRGIRHFSIHIRPIQQAGAVTGSLIVLREVTQLREHEQELDLLKQVLSRVFRHNIRNRLNVIQGHMHVIEDGLNGSYQSHTTTISENIDQLLSHSEKAVDMQGVIDTDTATSTSSLKTIVYRELATLQQNYPEITVRADCVDVSVQCHPDIKKAVQELLENTVAHAEGSLDDLRLGVTVAHCDGMGRLVIEDNGPGIAVQEIEALNAGEETELKHGSGVGLWLVRLLVEKSGGTLTIDTETGLGGTRVELLLPSPTDTHEPRGDCQPSE